MCKGVNDNSDDINDDDDDDDDDDRATPYSSHPFGELTSLMTTSFSAHLVMHELHPCNENS